MRPKHFFTLAIIFTVLAVPACSNPSLKKTVDYINKSYKYESKVKTIFDDLDKDTDEWNTEFSEMTQVQESISNKESAKQLVGQEELNKEKDAIERMRGLADREDKRLMTAGGYVVRIERAREEATQKIEELKSTLGSGWAEDYIDISLQINEQRSVYYRTMYDLYTKVWDGSRLQLQVAEAKLALQTKANGADIDTYNAAIDEWNRFTTAINPRIESNTKEVEVFKKLVGSMDTAIDKLERKRSAIARDNSVRALFEKDMELADLK